MAIKKSGAGPAGPVRRSVTKETSGGPGKTKKTVITTETIESDPSEDTSNAVEPSEELGGFTESTDTRDFIGYDANLRAYMQTSGDVKEFTATLYKYDNIVKQKQYVCSSTQNEILTMHEVGMQLGSGTYRYLITFPPEVKLPPKAFVFNIHTIYDQYREKAGFSPIGDPRGGPPAVQRNGLEDTMQLMKTMIEMLKPMIAPQQANPMESMMSAYAMTQDILKRNLGENVSLYKELARAQREPAETKPTEPEERGPGIMETLIPLIEKFAPLILGNNPGSAALVQTVKAAPQFQQVLKNPSELHALVKEVDGKLGKTETDKILKKLNVKRPG